MVSIERTPSEWRDIAATVDRLLNFQAFHKDRVTTNKQSELLEDLIREVKMQDSYE